MDLRWIGFGEIEVDGRRYDHDLVIDGGVVGKRKKGASKAFRERYGHTPLSVAEEIPWGGQELFVGTGASGKLPVMPQVYEEARRRGIEIVTGPTPRMVERLRGMDARTVHAVVHITC